MPFYDDDSFALQRLYEKWVTMDEWLLYEEALPLLLGANPDTDFVNSKYEELRLKVKAEIEQGSLDVIRGKTGKDDVPRVKPATIYHWAIANKLDLPVELVNLMEFVLKTVMLAMPDSVLTDEAEHAQRSSDVEQILGACLAIVSNHPDKCKNKQGIIKAEKVLSLLDMYADRLFNGQPPELSSAIIRDIVNHWLMKLR